MASACRVCQAIRDAGSPPEAERWRHPNVAPEPTGGDVQMRADFAADEGLKAQAWAGEPQQGDLREHIEAMVGSVYSRIIDARRDLPPQESIVAWVEALVRDEVAKARSNASNEVGQVWQNALEMKYAQVQFERGMFEDALRTIIEENAPEPAAVYAQQALDHAKRAR